MRQFMEVLEGIATGLIVNEGGAYEGKRYGVNSPDSVYNDAGLYNYTIDPKPPYDGNTQQVTSEYVVSGKIVTTVWTISDLSDEDQEAKRITSRESMIKEGSILALIDDDRTTVGSTPVIEDRDAHNDWMKLLYDNKDNEGSNLFKPPASERQMLAIRFESQDSYTFTRFQDTWGWQWKMVLKRENVTNLAVAIYDQAGHYLYTTGKLLPESPGYWYTVCPPGQADLTPKDVYFKWLLGSATISGLEVYKGSEDTMSGSVKSDERYD